jgi:hypothetical protein
LPRDAAKALALITLAVENAPSNERIWIEDIYQSIFCGMSAGVRQQTEGLIASFRHRYAPRPGTEPQDSVGLSSRPLRTCSDGTPLPTLPIDDRRTDDSATAAASAAARRGATLQGGVMGIGTFGNQPGR